MVEWYRQVQQQCTGPLNDQSCSRHWMHVHACSRFLVSFPVFFNLYFLGIEILFNGHCILSTYCELGRHVENNLILELDSLLNWRSVTLLESWTRVVITQIHIQKAAGHHTMFIMHWAAGFIGYVYVSWIKHLMVKSHKWRRTSLQVWHWFSI